MKNIYFQNGNGTSDDTTTLNPEETTDWTDWTDWYSDLENSTTTVTIEDTTDNPTLAEETTNEIFTESETETETTTESTTETMTEPPTTTPGPQKQFCDNLRR